MRLTTIAVALLASSCVTSVKGSGDIVTQKQELREFRAVDLCCGFDVQIDQTGSSRVALRGDDNVLREIRTEVRGDTLFIDYERDAPDFRPTQPVEVRIEAGTLVGVRASGGSIVGLPTLDGPQVNVALSGASRLSVGRVDAIELDVSLSGGSSADLSGIAKRQDVDASGASHYLASNLRSRLLNIEASGGSSAAVWVTEDLRADLSGGSHVDYAGEPETSTQASGGSSVTRTR